MASHGASVVLKGLTKRYGNIVALAPTDLVVEPGEFFSLIGPSGSGKSTLLGSVAGFLPPTAGRIELDGKDVVSVPPYQRNLGMVFQSYSLFPHMSVFENVAFPLRLRKVGSGEITRRVERMLEIVRLPQLGSRRPEQLSGGQQQRIALARAAVYDPRLLLMDEPLGALDKNLREEMQYEIRQFHRTLGATILYVTHDQDEAATLSDRIAIMKDGRIAQVGGPRELYERPRNAFVAGFLGEANLFDVADVKKNGSDRLLITTRDGLQLASDTREESLDGSLVACIRPEALAIHEEGAQPQTHCKSYIPGRVQDVVYTAGTVRYHVTTDTGARCVVKLTSKRHLPQFDVGQAITLACSSADTLLIQKE
jgi:putative spermidine/putrescine transport system ATP-binding protein